MTQRPMRCCGKLRLDHAKRSRKTLMTDQILSTISAIEPELIAIRHDLHAHPETGFEERRTAGIVASTLRGWGLDVTDGVGRTGVVATLKGKQPGTRAIGLRADMDALNIKEATGLPYASTVS